MHSVSLDPDITDLATWGSGDLAEVVQSAAEKAVVAAKETKVATTVGTTEATDVPAPGKNPPAADSQTAKIPRRMHGPPTMRCENRFTMNLWR